MRPSGANLARGLVIASFVATLAWLGWRANFLDVRARPPFGSVAIAFDAPLAHPGYAWSHNGRMVSQFELATIAGPAHCGWQSATMLFIGWPPGTAAPDASRARQYIRDPQGVIHGPYRDLLGRGVRPPPDATPTGYRLGAIEIYLSPSDHNEWVYLVGPSDAERWPRSDPMTLCA